MFEGIEYYGCISFLKVVLVYLVKILMVSLIYVCELMMFEFGMGMEGVFQVCQVDVFGILNGIDLDVWNLGIDLELLVYYILKVLKKKGVI